MCWCGVRSGIFSGVGKDAVALAWSDMVRSFLPFIHIVMVY